MSKLVVKDLAGPSSSSNKIYIASGSELDIANSSGTINLAVDAGDIASGTLADARLSAGHILQVVTVAKTDISTMTQAADTYTTVMTGTITPSSTSNHILIFINMCFSQDEARYSNIQVYRDSTKIAQGDSAGSRTRTTVASNTNGDSDSQHNNFNSSMTFKDSPSSTSALSYTLRVGSVNAPSSNKLIINSSGDNVDSSYTMAGISNLILMEVKG
mgnify:CR=1 FL=1|tara:strand:+ start:195 stop:842 length:648 start_codon:yes stop_codon:yes gene_type:complete